jgi:hypothetical protein
MDGPCSALWERGPVLFGCLLPRAREGNKGGNEADYEYNRRRVRESNFQGAVSWGFPECRAESAKIEEQGYLLLIGVDTAEV